MVMRSSSVKRKTTLVDVWQLILKKTKQPFLHQCIDFASAIGLTDSKVIIISLSFNAFLLLINVI